MFINGFPERLDLVWAAGGEHASEIGVSIALDEGSVESGKTLDIGVAHSVGVPGARVARLVRMYEGDYFGEMGVVLGDVGEVGGGFTAFVRRGMEWEGLVVDGVYCFSPAWASGISE